MKRILLFCVLLGSSIISRATKINGAFKVADNRSIIIYLQEVVTANESRKPYQQELNIGAKRSFAMKVDVEKAGFFSLSVVMEKEKNKSVYSNVVYLTPDAKLNIEYQGNGQFGLVSNYSKIANEDNKALFEIHEKYNALLRSLFSGIPDQI